MLLGYGTPVPGCIALPRYGPRRAVSVAPWVERTPRTRAVVFPTCTADAAGGTVIASHSAATAGARAPSVTRTTSASSAGSTRRATCAARSATSSTRATSRCRPLPCPPPTALAARCSAPCWRCAWRESWGTRGTGGAAPESRKLFGRMWGNQRLRMRLWPAAGPHLTVHVRPGLPVCRPRAQGLP